MIKLQHTSNKKYWKNLEPCKFYKYQDGGDNVWLTREKLREFETALKKQLIEWLKTEPEKLSEVLAWLGKNVKEELDYRSRPFDKLGKARKSIVNVVLQLRQNNQLPAICFSDNRVACRELAKTLFYYFEKQQTEFEATSEFKQKFEIKNERKLLKIAKRKRDEKKNRKNVGRTKVNREDEEATDDNDDTDPFVGHRLRLKNVIAKYKLHVRHYDEELVLKIKQRLYKCGGQKESTQQLLQLIERGIAFHDAALSSVERQSVEILFRCGYLGIVFSTSTLALGINMPCKTVLFGIDTPYLTPLQYRQMSGRAGRRGFDHSGNVILMSIPTGKVRRLLTASLSTLRGNLPFTTTYLLRLLTSIYQGEKFTGEEPFETTVRMKKSAETALALLKNPFILYTQPEKKEAVQKETKLLALYSIQLLRWLGLLDRRGIPKGFAPIVNYLCGHEPGNLIFIYLLQKGLFHKLCEDRTKSSLEIKKTLVLVFAYLFTNFRVPLSWDPDDKTSYPSNGGPTVFLGNIPDDFKYCIDEYNNKVEEFSNDFSVLFSSDNDLSVQESVFSLTGNPRFSLMSMFSDIVRPYHEDFLFDEGMFPARLRDLVDHRGRKVYRNAYAYDFWLNGSRESLCFYNKIGERSSWYLIRDFNTILKKIATALSEVSKSTDAFTMTMNELSEGYNRKYRRAFKMREKFYAH